MHDQATPPPNPDDSAAGQAGSALQRRRMLLKGLGKGSAVVAAVVPIQTLAAIEPIRLCTVSGIQSNVGSNRTGGLTTNCQGYSQSTFANLANWPNPTTSPAGSTFSFGGSNFTDQSRFEDVFGVGSGSNSKLIQLFTLPNQSASEKTWVAAVLSAVKKRDLGLGPSASASPGYFPYTPEEVVGLFKSPRKAEAEAFFSGYLVRP